MIDLLAEVFESIARQRLRALATAFGVFWGILMLVVLLGGGRGLRNGVDQMFADTLVNSVWISTGRTSRPYQGLGAGRTLQLSLEDVEAIAAVVPELEELSPRQNLPGGLTYTRTNRRGEVQNGAFPTFGIGPGHATVERMRPLRGRMLSALDVALARKVLIVGERVAEMLFPGEDPVGQTVQIGGVPFLVVGLFTDPGGEGELLKAFMPYTTLTQTFDARRYAGIATATLRPGADVATMRARVRRLLARRQRFDPSDPSAVGVWVTEEQYRKLQQLLRGIDLAVIVVSLGTLLSGIVGISNILFVSVRERTAEFGLRRALGATPGSILAMVLAEAVLLSTTAGSLGLLAGVGLLSLARRANVRSEYFRDPGVDARAVLTALFVLVLTAMIAGYFPAREASRLNPNEALRQ